MKRLPEMMAAILMASCGGPPPPPPAPPPEPVAPPIVPFESPVVWTAEAGVQLDIGEDEPVTLDRLFIPLPTIGTDDVGLLVQCRLCDGQPIGYVDPDAVVWEQIPPEIAAWGSLSEFALSIRDAAARRDVDALRPVMAFDFTSSLVGPQTPEAAIAVWQNEEFRSLERVPSLLAEGIAHVDSGIWSAPLRFVEELGYRGLRLGFRQRPDGRWEWLYLIRGVVE